MSYLNNTVITVDAILTDKGRELLARNDGSFQITQFALADDEVDYSLYNTSSSFGTPFYGQAIQNIPLLQSFTNANVAMKYKLITLNKGTTSLPVVNIGFASVQLAQGASINITPQTLNYLNSISTYEPSGYIMTIGDGRLISTFTGVGITGTNTPSSTTNLSNTDLSITQIGTSFNITGTTTNILFGSTLKVLTTTLTVIGRDSGARNSIPLQITKTSN